MIGHSKPQVIDYEARTKGNVLLQFRGLTKHIPFIAEVNEDRHDSFTPCTNFPIILEKEARAMNFDYFLVFPWYFKTGVLEQETSLWQKARSLFAC